MASAVGRRLKSTQAMVLARGICVVGPGRGWPLSWAPWPSVALKVSSRITSTTTPRRTRPPCTQASEGPKQGRPAAKLLVPSSGSSTQRPGPFGDAASSDMRRCCSSADISSPSRGMCGQSAASSRCRRCCMARSASVIQVPSALRRAAGFWARGKISLRAAVRTSAATVAMSGVGAGVGIGMQKTVFLGTLWGLGPVHAISSPATGDWAAHCGVVGLGKGSPLPAPSALQPSPSGGNAGGEMA
ncbi:hypothetical protein THIX_20384 [Thiomonas sp. X19]|nr:hypothetical protein THIX_20384 [Thiomonas sp. X19]